MAATYRLDPERRLMMVTLSGRVTGGDLDAFTEEVKRDAAHDPSWPALVDASELNPAGLSTQVLRTRAAVPRRNPTRVAIVAPADVVFGLARMFQMMSEGRGNHIEVFRGMDDALAWLASDNGAA
jgi:hypothetical protein